MNSSIRNMYRMVHTGTNFAFLKRKETSQDKCYLNKTIEKY